MSLSPLAILACYSIKCVARGRDGTCIRHYPGFLLDATRGWTPRRDTTIYMKHVKQFYLLHKKKGVAFPLVKVVVSENGGGRWYVR